MCLCLRRFEMLIFNRDRDALPEGVWLTEKQFHGNIFLPFLGFSGGNFQEKSEFLKSFGHSILGPQYFPTCCCLLFSRLFLSSFSCLYTEHKLYTKQNEILCTNEKNISRG